MLDRLVHEHTILGIDPGTTVMGYAVIHTSGSRVQLLDMGVLDLRKLESHYEKLQKIFFRVTELLDDLIEGNESETAQEIRSKLATRHHEDDEEDVDIDDVFGSNGSGWTPGSTSRHAAETSADIEIKRGGGNGAS